MKRVSLWVGLLFLLCLSVIGVAAQEGETFTLKEVIGRGSIFGILWLGDGETIAVSNGLGVWLYPADDLNAEPRLIEVSGPRAFDPNGTRMAVVEDGGFGLYDLETGEQTQFFKSGHSIYNLLVFSADGEKLAAVVDPYQTPTRDTENGYGETLIHVWSLLSEAELAQLEGGPLRIYRYSDRLPPIAVAFSPDATKLAVMGNFTGGDMSISELYMIDLGSSEILTVGDYDGELTNDFVLEDARLVASVPGAPYIALVFDPQPQRFGIEFLGLNQSRLQVRSISPDARLALTIYQDEIRIEDTLTREVLTLLPPFKGLVRFSPDNERLAVVTGDRLAIYAIAELNADTALCGAAESTACLTYTDAHQPHQLAMEPDIVLSADNRALSPSGKWEVIYGWEDEQAHFLVNHEDGTTIRLEFQSETPGITPNTQYIRFNPDETIMAISFTAYLHGGTADNVTRVWDLSGDAPNPEPVASMSYYTALGNLIFSPDGSLLVTTSTNGAVFVWDTATWEQVAELLHPLRVYQLQFSHDSRTLKTLAYDGLIRVWERE